MRSTVAITPVPVSSVAKLVPPDVCSLVQIHKPPPYLTTSFTLYLVVVAWFGLYSIPLCT